MSAQRQAPCPKCGYNLEGGQGDATVCPECGTGASKFESRRLARARRWTTVRWVIWVVLGVMSVAAITTFASQLSEEIRWVGGAYLLTAVGLLIAGIASVRPRDHELAMFLVFIWWIACYVLFLVTMAMII